MNINEELVVEERVEEEEEERVEEDEELVEDDEERVEDEVVPRYSAKSLIEVLNELRYLYHKENKELKILLILYRSNKGINADKFKELLRTNGKYAKRYLNNLVNYGLVERYRVNGDIRIYYKLTEKGKIVAELILNLFRGEIF
ncbi:transcriptional regulator [Sulfolobus spindle-shaped virus 4]|uniref:Putative transcription regulator MarR family n=2 Tax=Alphafusellovirus TaxID=10475 RepID=A8TKI5_9VIRU|nr:transcriptional regulator [Sulfolobus spindle-shaped virus 4]YP_002221485.1 transcriptional regulator [Sulfolobus spindle-shaped virus 5]ABV26207.1 putative transcription regulator MarR family [Sulfolobus spindle-shaped virus 4]ABV26241.1 putative transcription regulator [Sulfolobus spindle-shaped virus 5]AQQ16870.1 ORF18 [Sulfolobus spindle-shaped virus 3]